MTQSHHPNSSNSTPISLTRDCSGNFHYTPFSRCLLVLLEEETLFSLPIFFDNTIRPLTLMTQSHHPNSSNSTPTSLMRDCSLVVLEEEEDREGNDLEK